MVRQTIITFLVIQLVVSDPAIFLKRKHIRSCVKGTFLRDDLAFSLVLVLVLGLKRGRDHFLNFLGAQMIL
jgi:hypothetical protein